MTQKPLILSLRDVHFSRQQGAGFSLHIQEFAVAQGQCVALIGASGCGKSTTLDILAGILRPTRCGQFLFCPQGAGLLPQPESSPHRLSLHKKPNQPASTVHNLAALWDKGHSNALAALRLAHMGYVLQTGGLLPFLPVGEQIMLGCTLLNQGETGVQRAKELAHILGIERLLSAYPASLSVGERQRVAIAKALASAPQLVLADEPTAALDPRNALTVMQLFTDLARSLGCTVIMVTHAPDMAHKMGFCPAPVHITPAGDSAIIQYSPAPINPAAQALQAARSENALCDK
jgi:putative ABC transport system ATP-binding protein